MSASCRVGPGILVCALAAVLSAATGSSAAAESSMRQRSRQQFNIQFEGYAQRKLADQTLALLDEARLELRQRLGLWPDGSVEVVIYTEGEYATKLSPTTWEAARFDGTIRIAKADLVAKKGTLRDLIYHEYVHALLRNMREVPTWFNEGLAQYAEPNNRLRHGDLLQRAARAGLLLPLAEMHESFLRFSDKGSAELAYAEALSLVDHMAKQRGVARLRGLLERLSDGEGFKQLFGELYAADMNKFERAWRRGILRAP